MGHSDIAAKELRCEYALDPMGIDAQRPRFSWTLESSLRRQKQTAYQIIVASSAGKLEINEHKVLTCATSADGKQFFIPIIYQAQKGRTHRCTLWSDRTLPQPNIEVFGYLLS